MLKEILIYLGVAIVFLVILKIFKIKWKFIISLLINILVGGIVLFLVNYIPGVTLEINALNALFVGILGVPAVIILLIYYFVK